MVRSIWLESQQAGSHAEHRILAPMPRGFEAQMGPDLVKAHLNGPAAGEALGDLLGRQCAIGTVE